MSKSKRKLTDDQMAQMMADKACGMSIKDMATKYGIGKSSVSNYIAEWNKNADADLPLPDMSRTEPAKSASESKTMDFEFLLSFQAKVQDKLTDTAELIIPGINDNARKNHMTTIGIGLDKLEKIRVRIDDLERQTGRAPVVRVVKPDRSANVIDMPDVTKEDGAPKVGKDKEGTNDD